MTKHFEKLALTLAAASLSARGATAIAVTFGAAGGIDPADAAAATPSARWVNDRRKTASSPSSLRPPKWVRASRPRCRLMLAEDLDADWSKVRVVQAGASNKLYGNPKFNHQQQTVGSYSVTGYYMTHAAWPARRPARCCSPMPPQLGKCRSAN